MIAEVVQLQPNDKCISNLKQYSTRSVPVRNGYRPGAGYTGGFAKNLKEILSEITTSPTLHLYSGRSDIGDVRVDLECPEATVNTTVEEFIAADSTSWEWVILDPPYKIKRRDILRDYGSARPLSGNTLLRDRLSLFLRSRAANVIWVDYCSPKIKGFTRSKIWLLLPVLPWENVRVMTWLSRTGPEMRFD